MPDYPIVIALIITYRRLELALATIRSVREMVVYPNIGFHIADDGSGAGYIQALLNEIGPSYHTTVSLTAQPSGGVGHNMNLGIETCLERADLWLHLEDDWALREPLDLTPCVELLVDDPNIGMVRLGRLSADLLGRSYSGAGKLWWLLQRNANPYIYSGNAALKHRRFHEAYGSYKEGLTPGKTELWYCGQFNANKEGPGIVWPAWLTYEQTFQHIGDHQSFKWWIETGGLTPAEAAEKFEKGDGNE